MKQSEELDNVYKEEHPIKRIPNDGQEEFEIEPIDWNDV